MSALPFRYSDDQRLALEEIVARAGGGEAREKFAAGRARFEKTVGGYKGRLATWDGHTYGTGGGNRKKYERIEQAARELSAALDDYGSWIAIADNADELLHLREGLSRVAPRAGKMAATGRKSQNLMRDRFFLALARYWHRDLGMHIGVNVNSPLNDFIEAASKGILDLAPTENIKDIISNVVRKGMKP